MSRRRLNKIVTGLRKITVSGREVFQVHSTPSIIYSNCELDSHADTCVAGPNCVIVEYSDQVTNVSAFTNELDTLQDVPIVTVATALDNPDVSTVILILHQALYLGDKIENTLLCPNQMRCYRIDVDDVPVYLAPINKPSTHATYTTKDDFNIPLSLNGVISYFQTRTPTHQELETCKWIILRDPNTWEPHSENFSYN
jgi:uncharacterized protein YbaR (Trm112 family)